MTDPDNRMQAAKAIAPVDEAEFNFQQKLKAGNCECGNQCFLISEERVDGKYRVWREHQPADCPHDCEDCEQEAMA